MSSSTALEPQAEQPKSEANPSANPVGTSYSANNNATNNSAGNPPSRDPVTATVDQEAQEQSQELEQPPKSPVKPGPRASRLQQAYNQALTHTLRKVSWDNFSSCYPTVSSANPALLRAVQSQMVSRLEMLCNREFTSILDNRQVVSRLNELEGLIADAAQRHGDAEANEVPPVVPHTLLPETILAAHMATHLRAHQSQLNARIQTTQAKNAALWDQIQAQRAEMTALLESLENATNDIDSAAKLLDPIIDNLSRETRDIEAEMDRVEAG